MLGRSVPRVSLRAPRGQSHLPGTHRPLLRLRCPCSGDRARADRPRLAHMAGGLLVTRTCLPRPAERARCLRRGGIGPGQPDCASGQSPDTVTPAAVAGGHLCGVEFSCDPVIASPVDGGVAPCPGYSRIRPSRTASRYRSTLLDVSLPTRVYLARARFRWVEAVPGLIPTTRATLSSFMPDA
jgi:hypothetical protein